MGFAAYKLKRFQTVAQQEKGEITILFPTVPNQFSIAKQEYFSLQELLEYPDFPLTAHIIVADAAGWEVAHNFGFGNIIIAENYINEKWTMQNGHYIYFKYYRNTTDTIEVDWCRPSGALYRSYALEKSGRYGKVDIAFNPCIVENLIDGVQNAGWVEDVLTGIEIEGEERNKLLLDTNTTYKIPYDVYPELYDFFYGSTPAVTTEDPFGPGGTTEPGGGTGSFDNTGDNIPNPNLPTASATSAGFITLFNPSLAELQNLASYMWSDLFDLDTLRKLFANPMDAILGLTIVPVPVPSAGTREVKVGNVSTGVSMTVAASQYVSLDCGTLDVKEFWGAYLDYDPYTKCEIYLPYIGTHALAVDDIMGKSVHLVYNVDILTGACCATISCNNTVLYSFLGQCSTQIPVNAVNYDNQVLAAITMATAIGTMVATGGATAPLSLGAVAATTANAIKPSIQKSGAMGGAGGMLGVQTPYLILTRPRQALPINQNVYSGYPSYITSKLGDLTGYTEVDSIHLEDIPASGQELSEIETLLKTGVIL